MRENGLGARRRRRYRVDTDSKHNLPIASNLLSRNREEARREIFTYIEVWYNRRRLHSSLGYTSPEEYEKLLEAV